MITAHRPLSTLGRSRLLMAAVLTAMVASLTVGLPGTAGADPCVGETPTVGIDDVEGVEGDDTDPSFEFTITISCEPTDPVTVDWVTMPDTATEGVDYTSASGTETFDALMNSSTERSAEVPVIGDTDIEADETFEVELTVTEGDPEVDKRTGLGTILNDDVYVSVADGSATEGNPVGFRVSLTDAAGQPVTSAHDIEIFYDTGDDNDTADDGDDYTGVDDDPETSDNTVTVDAGDSSALIPIPTTDDGDAEDDETFTLTLGEPTNAVLAGDGVATGTILDDEPRVWISDVTQPEGHSGTTDFEFEVHVDPPADEEVVVEYTTAENGSAKQSDDDYLAASSELTFPAGSDGVQIVTVQVEGDTHEEGDETFNVELQVSNGANVSVDEPGIGTIVDDDNPTVKIVDGEVDEGDDGETRDLNFTIKLVDEDGDPQPAGKDIVLEYSTTGETATPGEDYGSVGEDGDEPGTVTIPADEATWTLPVTVTGDDVAEDDETFTVTIDNADPDSNPDLTIDEDANPATGTIVNDDGPPTVTVDDASKVEGNNASAYRFMDFTVRLSHPSDDPVTVDFNTDDGTAQNENADGDYERKTGTLTFEDHETEKLVRIKVFEDTKPEANETFVVRLTEPAGEEPFNGQFPDGAKQIEGTGTIINDDGAGVSVDDVTVDEGDSGTRDAVFQVTADTTDHDGFTVDVATADDTATAGSDYTALETTTITFKSKQESATVVVPVRGDTDHEPDETFTLNLSNANFAVIADGQGVASIVNDDEAPVDDGGGDDGGTDGDSGGDDGGTTDDGPDLGEISRSAGTTRIETALQVSRDHWDQAPDVVLANAAKFPDALAGGTLSALLDAPLLLTFPDDLSDGVAAELDRLGAQTVWILGGPVAVSVEIQQQLLDAGYEVHRFFGEDRFATAAEIARGTGPSQAGEVVLALGAHDDPDRAWPDALSAGALAAVPDPLPVLLTTADSLPDATTSALSDLQATTVYLLGGTAAISEDVEAELTRLGYEIVRLAGASRWGTSAAVATEALRRHGDTDAADVVFATGQNFPDGLAAGALAARLNGLLLLVPTDQLADETAQFLAAHARRLDRGVIVGGEKAVTATVADHVADALVADG